MKLPFLCYNKCGDYMLSDEVLDKVIDRVTRRIEQANTYVLEQIGKSIAKIGKLTPAQAQKLYQVILYGGDFDKIVKELAKITNLNVKDIYKIFEEVAKSDYEYAKKFYEYRNKKFIPYDQNITLKNEVEAIARETAQTYLNISNTLAFSKIVNGRIVYTELGKAYQETLDKAILSVSEGKTTFQEQMYQTIKELSSSGLKTLDYGGRKMRLDSAVNMHMRGGIRALHNRVEDIIGEEIGADGVEITVHGHPAPDHEEVQGRQFSNEEYAKLNDGLEAKDYKGNIYTLDHDDNGSYRPISTMNCYHDKVSIILGVNEPQYSDKELKKIIDDNEKGFELDGKHYTLYEGTQLQRLLERKIREQKDTQIMAKAADQEYLAGEAQNKIRIFTDKYKELSNISGLPTKLERARVSSYKRSAISTKVYTEEINKMKIGEFDVSKYTNEIKPTTKDVILTPKQDFHIKVDHPEVMPWYDKMTDIIKNPDHVYMQLKGKSDTVWLTKQYGEDNIKMTIKINTSTLYQKKTAGYKNSIIQMQPLPKNRIDKKIEKGDIKELFDLTKKK